MVKNNYFRYAATLGVFCLAASALLGVAYHFTRPKILSQETAQEATGLREVFPQADSFEPVREGAETIYYKALGRSEKILGYAFKAVKRGYASDIVTMVGMDRDGAIMRVKILSQNETPGLGTKIVEVVQKETAWDAFLKKIKMGRAPQPWFQAQFRGIRIENLDSRRAEECGKKMKTKVTDAACEGSVAAITGATISSRAVIESIREKGRLILERELEREKRG